MGPSLSHDPERILERAAADAAEADRIGEAFAGGAGDGEGTEPLPAAAQSRQGRRVLDKDAAVHHPRHAAEVIDVLGVTPGRVPVAVLDLLGQVDALVDVTHP